MAPKEWVPVSDELEKLWKKAVVAYFKVLHQNFGSCGS